MSQSDPDKSYEDDPEEGGSGHLRNPYNDERGTSNKAAHDVSSRKLNEYCFKMVRYRHMDMELARFIMIKSILAPSQLYMHTKRSKQIKN